MTAAASAGGERIGDLLVKEGLITREQLQKALDEQRQSGTRVGYNLVKLGFIQENELTRTLARQFKMPAVDLSKFEVDTKIIKLVPTDLATENLVLPLKRDGRTLTVAMADPTNLGVIEDLKFITRYDIFPVIAGEFTLRNVIEKHYESNEQQMSALLTEIEGLEDGEVEVVEEKEEEMSATALAAAVDDAPVVKLINAILTNAVKMGASDIHFECFEKELRVRYRIDGHLEEVMKPPKKMQPALISRFKIMSALNIAERRVPQDGRIKLKLSANKVVDFRVSTLPTLFGEKVVLRILSQSNLMDLDKLGIEPQAERDLMHAVRSPYGMVLVTGPTGSGKTTTLYSSIKLINMVETNIIMVGEIRDLETGGIAIKAALTGHLVLSTLHTNSTAETVTRLLDVGLEPFNVSSALNLVLAQRLLRRVCSNCKEQYRLSEEEVAAAKWTDTTTLRDLRFKQDAIDGLKARAPDDVTPLLASVTLDTKAKDMPFFRGKGCDACKGSGSRGRQGAYEGMNMTPGLRRLILQNVGAAEIKDFAIDEGMLTLRMDGLVTVWKGITSLEQVITETSA